MRPQTLHKVRLPNHSVRLMAGLLRERKYAAEAAAVQAGISPEELENPQGEISGAQEVGYQLAFHDLCRDRPDLWVELGCRYRALTHGHLSLGLAMATAPDVSGMLDVSLQYSDLHYSLSGLAIIRRHGRIVGFRSTEGDIPERLRAFTLLRDLAAGSSIMRDFCGVDVAVERIETTLPPHYAGLVRPLYGNIPVQFAASQCAWYWHGCTDDSPLPQSNPLLNQRFRGECEAALAAVRGEACIGQQVTAEIARQGWEVTLESAASAMHLSVRTLQRKLSEAGISFRGLLNGARHQRARQLLRESDISIAEIGWMLGYQNVPSFTRAFKAAEGLSPGQFRQRAAARNLVA